ncbi:LysM domain-containing protein 2 [Elsinoe fawcettii]|nr:LysM domain-containing protein 2 [Elsinoe fawcettii]
MKLTVVPFLLCMISPYTIEAYTIKNGDTFFAIAKQMGIPLETLLSTNSGVDPRKLQIGQTINIPGDVPGTGDSRPGPPAPNPGDNQPGSPAPNPGDGQPAPPAPGPVGGVSGPSVGGGYTWYGGPASNFPDPKFWANYTTLVADNSRLMRYSQSNDTVELIIEGVNKVSDESQVDPRIILCVIMQESGGNPKVVTTNNGVRNPGLMQSHNGTEFNPADPSGSITQMIRDGTTGTPYGDGLKQLNETYGNWYEAFRGYNSGSVDKSDLNHAFTATEHYVRNVANRLMGHVWNGM